MNKKIKLSLLLMFLGIFGWSQEELNMSLLSQVSFDALGNDVWTYVDSVGTEYVIAGNRVNSQIFSLQDPTNLKMIAEIPGSRSVWRDFKSYKNYLYIVADQGEDGVTIVDMSMAPDSVSFEMWTDTIKLSNDIDVIKRCHNIYIDTLKGQAFLSGCNNGIGGIIILDLTADPTNPTVIGIENQAYSHDVITQNNRMYTSEIFEGVLGIYDISDPTDPVFINKTFTSTFFTHNSWPSDDGNYIFTTDEKGNGYVDAYDISDENNIKFLDKYRPSDNSNILPHNTHFIDDYLVTSWYTEGVIILDASRPHNLIRVAQYDTNPQDNNGNWGVTPYLPSGLIAATDMDNGLYILEADYQRAAYLEGAVFDIETGEPINGVEIKITDGSNPIQTTGPTGEYATGTVFGGQYEIVVSHPDYFPDTISLILSNGELTEQNFMLQLRRQHILSGKTVDSNGAPLPNVEILIDGTNSIPLTSDEDGDFNITLFSGDKEIKFAKWGYLGNIETLKLDVDKEITLRLTQGLEDDFFTDLGWSVSSSSESGIWERVIPNATVFNGNFSNPNEDVPDDIGAFAYVTGNDAISVGSDDVDAGSTHLISPPIDLTGYEDPEISFSYWFFNNGGNSAPNDELTIQLIDSQDTLNVDRITDNSTWTPFKLNVKDHSQKDTVRLYISISDDIEAGHLVEGGIDAFKVVDNGTTTNIQELEQLNRLNIYPNPTTHIVYIADNIEIDKALLFDIKGEKYSTYVDGNEILINQVPSGMYFLKIVDSEGKYYSAQLSIVK